MHGNSTLQSGDRHHEYARMRDWNGENERYRGLDCDYDRKMLVGAESLAWLMECDASTIRRWSRTGIMPSPLKIGGRTLWDAEAIRTWIRDGCPTNQTEQA